jgi:putative nucleotidyltransferase with HDIG domain
MTSKSNNNYPSVEECMKLIEKYEMLPNIVDHSIQVKNVSEVIYNHIIDKSNINLKLLVASALLHDIAKTKSIHENNKRHDLLGGQMLRDLGFDDIAVIVENHVVFTGFDDDGPLTEKEIIYYADKRVMHDKVVTIDVRVDDLAARYGINVNIKQMILDNKKFILQLEAKIQRFMDMDLEESLKDL